MGIFDRFSKKEQPKQEEFEEYIDEEQQVKEKMQTTLDKVDLAKLNNEEFEAYVRNPEIFESTAEEVLAKESLNNGETDLEADVEEVEVDLPKGNIFGKMKVKFPSIKKDKVSKETPIEETETVSEEVSEVDDVDTYGFEEEEIPLESLSLDELEKLYDEDSDKLEEKTAIEDLTGVVSLRGVNKRFERLSEKEERRKEKEREKKKIARRKLINGTFALLIFGGAFYFTYAAFETPINNFASESVLTVKARVISIFNADVQNKFEDSVTDVFTKNEKEERVANYGKTFPLEIDVDKTPIEDLTIPSGNYIVGEHIPSGNYFVQGKISLYASDVDLKVKAASDSNDYQNNIVHLGKDTIISLEGTMYPNEYRSASILEPSQLKNDVLYEVDRDIEKGARYYVTGQGKIEYLDKTLKVIEEKTINNTKTVEIKDVKFVRFTGVESFELK